MPRTFEGFTFKEHQKIGKDLHQLRRQVKTLESKVAVAYGTSSRSVELIEKIVKDIGQLQGELNDRLCEEHENRDNVEIFACYYPKEK